ncbi:MAG: hypothetical protein D6767_07210 [Candidatus Hydrogenedentota bacterium]|nr:MAG: hypothetical protein D6767_07210 [Candidatus Hydrogenedentota bacterium]
MMRQIYFFLSFTVLLFSFHCFGGQEFPENKQTSQTTQSTPSPTFTVSFNSTSQTTASETGTVLVTVTLSAKQNTDVAIPFTVNATSTATSPADYSIPSSSVTIAAGSLSADITVTLNDDSLTEGTETIILNLSTPSLGSLGNITTHTINITDDDIVYPSVSFTAASQASTSESGTMSITVQLSSPTVVDVTVPFTVNPSSTASSPSDYTISNSPVTIPQGNSSATITITIATDTLYEANETIVVDMGTPTNATQGSITTHTATITDDDTMPSVSFASASSSAKESDASATVSVQLSTTSGVTTTVPFTVSGTANNPSDHDLASGTFTIPAGQTSSSITINIINDSTAELSETIVLTMGSPTNATQGSITTHTLTILQSDVQIVGQVLDATTSTALAGVSVSTTDSALNLISDTTDSSGNFVLTSDDFTETSSYVLTLSKTNYITRSDVSATINAGSNSITGNPVSLVRNSGNIVGQVLDDHTLNPLSGVTVSATDGAGNVKTTTTDASGNFILTSSDFWLGYSYTVNFSKSNYYAGNTTVNMTIAGNNTISTNPYALYINASITGTAVSDIGGGASGVTVSVTDENNNVLTATTAADGSFTINGTGSPPNNSFHKGKSYTVSFTSVDYNNNSATVSSVAEGSNTILPNPITLVTYKDGNHKVTGRVVDYWDDSVGITTGIDSARIEIDDESGTVSVTAAADGTFTATINAIATKTYPIRILVPVTGSMVSQYTGETDTTKTATTFTATNVAPAPPPSNTQSIGNFMLYPIGIRAVIDGTNKKFSGHIKQTNERFLTGKTGFTLSARDCATCDFTELKTAESFFLHADESSPMTIPASLLPSSNYDPNRGNPNITDIRVTTLPVNGASRRGAIQEGLQNDTRAAAWGITGSVFYAIQVTNTGSFTVNTTGGVNLKLTLYDPSGTQLGTASGTNPSLNQTLPAGWNFLKVQGATNNDYGIFDVSLIGPNQTSSPTGTWTTNDLILSWYSNTEKLLYIAGNNEQNSSGSLTISRIDAVGGIARGTFSGTLKAIDPAATAKTVTNGYFNVIREE